MISLVQGNEIGNALLNLLNVDSIKNEFIEIPNATALVEFQKKINERFHKEDIESSLEDMSLYSSNGDFSINFNNLASNRYFETLGISNICTAPIYSARNDFFSELYQMDRYATQLIQNGYRDIVEMNWERLKQVTSFKKNYRILHDLEDNDFSLRAITSTKQYHNYDNNIAIVIALLTLHNEMKGGAIKFRLSEFIINESFIKMFFESSEKMPLEGIGYVKNFIEVSNDEIKREALRFSGACSICFSDGQNIQGDLYIQPQEISTKILSIRHSVKPQTANQELAGIANSKKIHAELFEDIKTIKNIQKPEQIKVLLQQKIENAKREDIGNHKMQLQEILKQSASNIFQLLNIFSKIAVFAKEDVGVTEYLRIAIYEALIKRKSSSQSRF